MPHDLPVPVHQAIPSARDIDAIVPSARGQPRLPAPRTAEMVPLLFALSLAVALPPDAIIAPFSPSEPTIHIEPLAILGVEAVMATLGRATVAVGAGYVFLHEVDRRLAGLVARLNAHRVTDAPTALVSTGLVGGDAPPIEGLRSTPRELWELSRDALARRGQACEPVASLGDDAFMTLHGDHTAQVAWMAGERLATVGVTSLGADKAWVIAAARSIAELANDRRGINAGPEPAPSLSGGTP